MVESHRGAMRTGMGRPITVIHGARNRVPGKKPQVKVAPGLRRVLTGVVRLGVETLFSLLISFLCYVVGYGEHDFPLYKRGIEGDFGL